MAGNDRLDEGHAAQTGSDTRHFGRAPQADGRGEVGIEIGHRFEIPLGMPGGEAQTPKRLIAQPTLVDSGPQHP